MSVSSFERIVRAKGPAIIARLPFDPRLADACDQGVPFVKEYADAPLAKQLVEIAGLLDGLLAASAPRAQL